MEAAKEAAKHEDQIERLIQLNKKAVKGDEEVADLTTKDSVRSLHSYHKD